MKNKVVYITGGSKGIGFGIAKYLLDNGLRVAISGRKENEVNDAAKKMSNIEDNILAIVSDVKNIDDEKNAVAQIIKKWGQLDVVIANAGIGIFAPVDQLSEEDWKNLIDTNLTGVFHTLKASVEALKKSKGYYITMASLAGTNFFVKGAGYNATKYGVVGFSQAAMLDLRQYDIKVTTIMPGSVSSYFNNNNPNENDAWKIQPEDLGQMIWDLLQMNPRTLPSKIEVRPTRPDTK